MSDELDEVWGLYADEGEQSLEAMEDALLILKSTPTDTNTIGSLFRAMHTFKGNSRVMGLSVIESRAHVAEDLIGLVRDEGVPLDDELTDLLLEMVDILHPMLSQVCSTQLDATPDTSNDLVDRMKDKLVRCREIKSGVPAAKKSPAEKSTPVVLESTVEAELEPEVDNSAPLAMIFDNTESLANDPMFRELFSSMAKDIFQEMDVALAEFATDSTLAQTHFSEACQRLQVAAEQIKLPEWQAILGKFLAIAKPKESQIKTLHTRLFALFESDFGSAETLIEELLVEDDDGGELAFVIGVDESELVLNDDELESIIEDETPSAPLAIIFDNSETLANDPIYRELFSSMADSIFKEMQDALVEFETDFLEQAQINFLEANQRLLVAVEQIKLPEWQAVLGDFFAISNVTEEIANALYTRLLILFERDFGNAETPIELEAIQSMIFDKTESLANDPVYLEIFAGMAHDILREMKNQLSNFIESPTMSQTHLLEETTRLLFYSKQIGLHHWQSKLEQFLALELPTFEQAETLIEQLTALSNNLRVINHGNVDDNDSNVQFFAKLQKPLRVFSIYSQIEKEVNVTVGIGELSDATREIKALAESFGFLHLVDASERFLADVETGETIDEVVHRFEFQLYEGLVSIENVASSQQINTGFDAKSFLGGVCANRVFENLLTINNILDSVKNQIEVSANCVHITQLLREVYYACLHYKLDTAAHLCTALSDLFARVLNDVMKLDAVMVHIAKSFIADLELVLASVGSGDIPDMKLIEKLLDETSTATFVSSGTLSSQSIEARLSLPKSFHKVLTAESVKVATVALDSGNNFYIIRADLEQDEDLACNFLNWIESGAVKSISNVTVFRDNRTLFDFLLATPLNFIQITEALITLDPCEKSIVIERELIDRKSGIDKDNVPNDNVFLNETDVPVNSNHGQMSSSMLESIGELVTHQAMVQHLLDELAKDDLIKTVSSKTKGLHGQLAIVREEICNSLLVWQEKIEKMVQIGVQTGSLLSQLQEEAISGRMRSVSQLLKPLVPFVEGLAQKNQRIIDFTMEGDDISLDITMLENMKSPLRALLGFCILQSIETPERRAAMGKDGRGSLRIMLVERDDHVQVIIEDDGVGIDLERVSQRAMQLGWLNEKPKLDMVFRKEYGITTNDDATYGGLSFSDIKEFLSPIGGNLKIANLPSGGLRLTLTMSLTMLLLDGMVVRVGAVQYIVPIDSIQSIVRTDSDSLMRLSAEDGRYMLNIENGDIIPVQFLKGNHEGATSIEEEFIHDEKHLFVIIINKQKQCVAIKVNELIGQQNILSRPLQGYLSHIRGVIGCTLLGSGDVGLVLDINALFGDSYSH